MIEGHVRRDGLTRPDEFRGRSLMPKRYAHDLDSKVTLKITSDQWQHVACKSNQFLVLEGLIRDGIIDTTSPRSGVMTCPDSRIASLS